VSSTSFTRFDILRNECCCIAASPMRRECLRLMLESRYKFHANKRHAFNIARLRVSDHRNLALPGRRDACFRLPTNNLGCLRRCDRPHLTCIQPPRPAGRSAVHTDSSAGQSRASFGKTSSVIHTAYSTTHATISIVFRLRITRQPYYTSK
jgi:hypothetical protein